MLYEAPPTADWLPKVLYPKPTLNLATSDESAFKPFHNHISESATDALFVLNRLETGL